MQASIASWRVLNFEFAHFVNRWSCSAIQRVFCFLEIGAVCLVIESNLNLLGRRSETDWTT